MLTIIQAAQQMTRWQIILRGVILTTSFAVLSFLCFRTNRRAIDITIFLNALLVLLEICDAVWYVIFSRMGNISIRDWVPLLFSFSSLYYVSS